MQHSPNPLQTNKFYSESILAKNFIPVHSDSSVQSPSNFSPKNHNFQSSILRKKITDFKTENSKSLDDLKNTSNFPRHFVSSIVISLKELIKKVNY